MEAYFRNGGLPPFYRCDEVKNWTYDEWLLQGELQVALGCECLIYGASCIILYLPCLYVLLQRDLVGITAYKLLFLLTLLEIGNLLTNSVAAGIFFIQGIVYCNYPNLIYVMGCLVMSFWTGVCVTCFILGLSRLVDLWNPLWHDAIFGGKRIIFSLLLIFSYMSFMFLYTKPAVFNSRQLTWDFDPRVYPDGKMFMMYASMPTNFNNMGTCVCTLLITITFTFSFVYKYTLHNFTLSTFQKQLFIQSTVACSNSLISALIYVSYSYIPISRFVNYLGLLTWQLSSAGELIVFLFLNVTIRRRVLRILHVHNNPSSVHVASSAYRVRNPDSVHPENPNFEVRPSGVSVSLPKKESVVQ